MKRKGYKDGGKVEYPKPTYMGSVKERVKEMVGAGIKNSTPKAVTGDARLKRTNDAVDKAVNGYRDGGMVGKLVKKHKC